MAAQPGLATVPELFHGVPGGCPHAGPPDQEGAEGTAQNGGQLPQVELGFGVPPPQLMLFCHILCLLFTADCVHIARET